MGHHTAEVSVFRNRRKSMSSVIWRAGTETISVNDSSWAKAVVPLPAGLTLPANATLLVSNRLAPNTPLNPGPRPGGAGPLYSSFIRPKSDGAAIEILIVDIDNRAHTATI